MLLVFLVLGLLATPLAAEAQQAARVHRIGYISMRSGPADNVALDGFRRGLRELGYLEGRDVVLEIRYAGAGTKTLSDLAAELAVSRSTSSSPRAGSRRAPPGKRHERSPS